MSADIVPIGTRPAAVVPPLSIEAEQVVIGTILMRNETFGTLVSHVGEADFSEEIHRRVFAVSSELIGAGKPSTPNTLKPFLGTDEIVPGMSTQNYLARLCSMALPPTAAVGHARIVRDLAVRRAIVECAAAIDAHARNAHVGEDASTIAAEHMMKLQHIAAASGGDTARHVSTYADELLELVNGVRTGEITHRIVTTGYRDLDDATSGYVPGALWISAGRPGMGKSIFANATAYRCAKTGVGVLEFPLEIGAEQMVARHLADIAYRGAGSPAFRDIGRRAAELTDDQAEAVWEANATLRRLPIEIDKRSRITVAQISAKVAQTRRAMAARGVELGLVVIDHLDFIHASDRYSGNRTQEIGEICLGLKDVARTQAVCVNLLCQLNRGLEQRGPKDRRPNLADLRNSGDLEQVADVVMFLYREEYYATRSPEYAAGDPEAHRLAEEVRGKLELILGKVRAGPTKTVHAFCNVASSTIASHEWRR